MEVAFDIGTPGCDLEAIHSICMELSGETVFAEEAQALKQGPLEGAEIWCFFKIIINDKAI